MSADLPPAFSGTIVAMEPVTLIATAKFGLEAVVKREVLALGFTLIPLGSVSSAVLAQPKRLGEYKLEASASIHNMVLKGERLYISHYHHGVRVLDVSVPESPKRGMASTADRPPTRANASASPPTPSISRRRLRSEGRGRDPDALARRCR